MRRNTDSQEDKVIEFRKRHEQKERRISGGALTILMIVVTAFVLWPILGRPGFQQTLGLGSYRGTEISYSQGYGLFNNQLQSYLSRFPRDLPVGELRRVFENAFFQVVKALGISYALEDEGIYASEQEVNELIVKELQRQNGGNAMIDPSAIESNKLADIQNTMHYAVTERLWNLMYHSQTIVSEEFAPLLLPTLGDMRKFSYLYFEADDFPIEKIREYYEENKILFEERELMRITLNRDSDLRKAESELARGYLFPDVAKKYSVDVYASEGGRMGSTPFYELMEFLEENGIEQAEKKTTEVFQAPLSKSFGESSYQGPYKVNGQWILYSTDTADTEPKEFEDLRDQVLSYLKRHDLSRITDHFRGLFTQAFDNAGQRDLPLLQLKRIGRLTGAEYGETKDFIGFSYSPSYGGLYQPLSQAIEDSALANLAQGSETFYESGFSLARSETSGPILLGERYILVLRAEEIRPVKIEDSVDPEDEGLVPRLNVLLEGLQVYTHELEFLEPGNLSEDFNGAFSLYAAGLENSTG